MAGATLISRHVNITAKPTHYQGDVHRQELTFVDMSYGQKIRIIVIWQKRAHLCPRREIRKKLWSSTSEEVRAKVFHFSCVIENF